MPSIVVTYSPNLVGEFDESKLAIALNKRAQELGVFPSWGIRVFVVPATAASVAEESQGSGYVQVAARIAPGRSEELQTQITHELFMVLEEHLRHIKSRTIGYAVDVSEFNRANYESGGNLAGSPTA